MAQDDPAGGLELAHLAVFGPTVAFLVDPASKHLCGETVEVHSVTEHAEVAKRARSCSVDAFLL